MANGDDYEREMSEKSLCEFILQMHVSRVKIIYILKYKEINIVI